MTTPDISALGPITRNRIPMPTASRGSHDSPRADLAVPRRARIFPRLAHLRAIEIGWQPRIYPRLAPLRAIGFRCPPRIYPRLAPFRAIGFGYLLQV